MNNNSQLIYLKHSEINSGRWNECIINASNSRVYANDWHLDRTAIIWDALIWGDYEFVMPIPVRRKFGLKYIYQPLFSQQLGIFPSPPEKIANAFYAKTIQLFNYSDVQINSENTPVKTVGIEFAPRKNYLLNLSEKYEVLAKSYSTNTKRNLKKSAKNQLIFVAGIRLEDFMAFKRQNMVAKIEKTDLQNLKSLIAFGQYKGFGEICGVYSKQNQLCAAVYFCRWKNRVIYMNAVSNEVGKKLGAMNFLTDNFIRQNSGKNLLLDFEGSMIPGIARFYAGFGATPETYFQLKFNRLPLPFKWLKR